MAEEITVTAAPEPKRRAAGLSPLQAGLLYGGAASAVMGPFGLLVGLGAGITAKRMRNNYLDREAQHIANMRAEQLEFNEEITRELEIADPDEARLLSHAKRLADAGWQRLESGDESGRELVDRANAFAAGIMNADSQARKQEEASQATVQRSLITTAANDYRARYQTAISDFEAVENQALRVLDLTAQADFDPNKPFNKAILAELLSTGVGGFYRDAPDAMDAIVQGTSGFSSLPGIGGIAGDVGGGVIQGITTAIKAKDFQVTREDYNRIALNLKKLAEQLTRGRMGRLSEEAQQLDVFARRTGAIPEDYSLGDYISGGTKELRIQPVQQPRNTRITPPTSTATRALTNHTQHQKGARPVN